MSPDALRSQWSHGAASCDRLRIGLSDADLVVWDDEKVRVIDGEGMYSRADYSPYDGFEVQGWPKWTLARGELAQADGRVTGAKGRAKLARRGSHRAI